MTIGVALSPAVDESANLVDVVVGQAQAAAEAGLGSVWLGQRFDYDSVGLAGIVGRLGGYSGNWVRFDGGATIEVVRGWGL